MTAFVVRASRRLVNVALHHLTRFYGPTNRAGQWPPVFLVGAPRTGSTVLYQAITNGFKVGYIDNCAARFYGSLPLGLRLSRRRYGMEAHGSFRSDYGDTFQESGHAPNECGEFWYRWLPRDEHFADFDALGPGRRHHLRTEILRATQIVAMPLVFKNLNVGQRLRLISQVFPEARIIWCRRGRPYTVQSILAARRNLGWPENRLWSVRPRGWRDLESLPAVEQVCRQVVMLEQQIAQDIRLFPPSQVRVVEHDDWTTDPLGGLALLGASLDLEPRSGAPFPDVREGREKVRDQEQFLEIGACLDRLARETAAGIEGHSGESAR